MFRRFMFNAKHMQPRLSLGVLVVILVALVAMFIYGAAHSRAPPWGRTKGLVGNIPHRRSPAGPLQAPPGGVVGAQHMRRLPKESADQDPAVGMGPPEPGMGGKFSLNSQGESKKLLKGKAQKQPKGQAKRQPNGQGERQLNGQAKRQPNGQGQRQPNGQTQKERNGQAQKWSNGQAQNQPNGQGQRPLNGQGQRQPSGQGQRQPNGQGQRQPNGQTQKQLNGQAQKRSNGQAQNQPNGLWQRQPNGQAKRQLNGQGQRQPNGQAQNQPNGLWQRQPNGQAQKQQMGKKGQRGPEKKKDFLNGKMANFAGSLTAKKGRNGFNNNKIMKNIHQNLKYPEKGGDTKNVKKRALKNKQQNNRM